MKKITILKGSIDNIKIANTTLPLYNIDTVNGVTSALVDASAVLGDEFKRVIVVLENYKI
jgi:hypothetical protein